MPVCLIAHEVVGINFDEPVKVMSIPHTICTCDDTDCGDVYIYKAFPVTPVDVKTDVWYNIIYYIMEI